MKVNHDSIIIFFSLEALGKYRAPRNQYAKGKNEVLSFLIITLYSSLSGDNDRADMASADHCGQ